MEKHLLVAVSDEFQTSQSLRFVHHFFTEIADLKLTLFYVVPRRPDWRLDPINLEATPEAVVHIEQDKAAHGVPAMEKAREWLHTMGFAKDQVRVKFSQGKLGTVKEIVKESEEGLYDAAVLGRRGLSWFEEMVTDSVSHRILWESLTFPIWICRNTDRERKNVLVCVDGSEECLRVADHVGYMLRHEPSHDITLLHVCADDRCIDAEQIFGRAMAEIKSNDIADDRISIKVMTSSNPAKTILHEADSRKYAAVAIGRTSHRPSTLNHIFATTSLKILRGIEGAALWLCK
ncbi:UspA domain-containing protein [Solidesulfovibrio carbinoliphilus subsp. oakridgensis]|uniref:UspA domain-containing protein n=1 Tax=Solidesulfovibrio carbinoliphilus subsp. oakridgensis TaxID=694327 RepID=G7Q6Y0_9BACT|nr:universal stress protein [Solidesulfovibrio carbinoliphilus]EHJ48463.1 UspA domain-containing protein [Solidesulfovibrio carbinoliphilus subsp. oakridgensis]